MEAWRIDAYDYHLKPLVFRRALSPLTLPRSGLEHILIHVRQKFGNCGRGEQARLRRHASAPAYMLLHAGTRGWTMVRVVPEDAVGQELNDRGQHQIN